MSAHSVPLGEVCEINPSTVFDLRDDSPCTFVPMEAVDDWFAQIVKLATRPFREVSRGYSSFAENDVLLAKITPCMENGKCAIARGLRDRVGFGSTEFHVLRASKYVLPEWLFYFWRLPKTRQNAERSMTGTAGQKRVPSSHLERVKIPLPNLPEQKRIAAVLERADRLRRTRRYALELSDSFLPSTFLKLFGDPGENSRGFERIQVNSLFAPDRDGVKCGPFGSALKKHEYVEHGIPVWTMGNVHENSFCEDDCLFITEKKYQELEAYNAQNGDILVSRAGTVGRMAIVKTKHNRSIIHSNLIRLSLDPRKVNPIYVVVLMTWFGARVAKLKTGQEDAYTFMNTDTLGDMSIPLPSISQQQKFAELVERYERLRSKQREALRQADHLFQSVLHRAFTTGL